MQVSTFLGVGTHLVSMMMTGNWQQPCTSTQTSLSRSVSPLFFLCIFVEVFFDINVCMHAKSSSCIVGVGVVVVRVAEAVVVNIVIPVVVVKLARLVVVAVDFVVFFCLQ